MMQSYQRDTQEEIEFEKIRADAVIAAPAAVRGSLLLPTSVVIAALIIGGAIIYRGKMEKAGTGAASTVNALSPQPTLAAAAPVAPAPQPANPVNVSADDDPFLGKKDAPITIIAFEDYQCPFCGRLNTDVLPQLKEQYIKIGKARYVFRDYPLPFHQFAQKAHEAANCAGDQGKYWEMRDALYANQLALDTPNLKIYAKNLGLNQAKFDQCLDSGTHKDEIAKDYADGSAAGVNGTPTLFINGRMVVGAQPLSVFTAVIEEELKKITK